MVIEVPLQPAVIHALRSRYPDTYPFKYHPRRLESNLLFSLLEHGKPRQFEEYGSFTNLREAFSIQLTATHVGKQLRRFSSEKLIVYEQTVISFAIKELVQEVIHHIEVGHSFTNAITVARVIYSIDEEDYSHDALKKAVQRERKRRLKALQTGG